MKKSFLSLVLVLCITVTAFSSCNKEFVDPNCLALNGGVPQILPGGNQNSVSVSYNGAVISVIPLIHSGGSLAAVTRGTGIITLPPVRPNGTGSFTYSPGFTANGSPKGDPTATVWVVELTWNGTTYVPSIIPRSGVVCNTVNPATWVDQQTGQSMATIPMAVPIEIDLNTGVFYTTL